MIWLSQIIGNAKSFYVNFKLDAFGIRAYVDGLFNKKSATYGTENI